jgi:hypothetical protein
VAAQAAAHEGARRAVSSLTLCGLFALALNAAAAAPFAAAHVERAALACAMGGAAVPIAEQQFCWDVGSARAATHVYAWWAVASAPPLLAAGALAVLRGEVNEAVARASLAAAQSGGKGAPRRGGGGKK